MGFSELFGRSEKLLSCFRGDSDSTGVDSMTPGIHCRHQAYFGNPHLRSAFNITKVFELFSEDSREGLDPMINVHRLSP